MSTTKLIKAMSTAKLIKAVYKYPELYDKDHKDYFNLLKKRRSWRMVGHEVGRFTGEQAKKKWTTLRSNYTSYMKTCAEKGGARKLSVWAQRMEIFRPFVAVSPSPAERSAPELGFQLPETTVDSEDDAHTEEVAQEPQTEPTRQPPTPPQSELIMCDMEINTAVVPKQETDRLSFQEQARPPGPVPTNRVGKRMCLLGRAELQTPAISHVEGRAGTDEIDSLFLVYAMTARKFSPRRQIMTKLKIAQLIAEEELAHVDETELLAAQACSHSMIP